MDTEIFDIYSTFNLKDGDYDRYGNKMLISEINFENTREYELDVKRGLLHDEHSKCNLCWVNHFNAKFELLYKTDK